jgi:hypothetical protein
VAAPKPGDVPVHPSLMRQFQFQSRVRIKETGTVSQILILTMETISQSQRATHMTPLALCQQCQRSAKPGARVPVCATLRTQHVVLFQSSLRGRRCPRWKSVERGPKRFWLQKTEAKPRPVADAHHTSEAQNEKCNHPTEVAPSMEAGGEGVISVVGQKIINSDCAWLCRGGPERAMTQTRPSLLAAN